MVEDHYNAVQLSANLCASTMPIQLPSGNTAHYLAAIDAAAIYVALPARVGALSLLLRFVVRGVL